MACDPKSTTEAGGGGRLAPCPMCGDDQPHFHNIEPHTHSPIAGFMPDHPGSSYVECTACCTAVMGTYPDGAVAIWNRRSLPAAAQALREAGWTVVEPTGAPLPAFAVGQRWVPSRGKAKARTVVSIGECQWYPFAGPVCLFFFADGDHSEKPRVLHPQAFKSWVKKQEARPVEAAP